MSDIVVGKDSVGASNLLPEEDTRARGGIGSNMKTVINFTSKEEIISTDTPLQRYTRSTLYLLRNKAYSRRRPECTLRGELQALGLWKFNNGGGGGGSGATLHLSNGNGDYCGSENHNTVPSGPMLHSSPVGSGFSHLRGTVQRGGLPGTSGGIQLMSHHHQVSGQANLSTNCSSHKPVTTAATTAFLDHRSISSAHLMPEFMKRRIVLPKTTTDGITVNAKNSSAVVTANASKATQSVVGRSAPASNSSSPARESAHRSDTPVTSTATLEYGRYGNRGVVSKDTSHGYGEYGWQRDRDYGSPLGKGTKSDTNRERGTSTFGTYYDRETGSNASSPGATVTGLPSWSASSPSSRHLGHSTHDRRIGSGRLLPRDTTWDYRSSGGGGAGSTIAHDKEYVVSGGKLKSPGKDIATSGRSTTFGRYGSDRGSGEGSDFSERRTYGNDTRYHDRHDSEVDRGSTNLHSKRFSEQSVGGSAGGHGDQASQHRQRRGQQQQPPNTHHHHVTIGNSHHTHGGHHTSHIYHHSTQNNHHIHGHHHGDKHAEEPEWFSGGPTSQHDTIELRGFEEETYTSSDIEASSRKPSSSISELPTSENECRVSEVEVSKCQTASGSLDDTCRLPLQETQVSLKDTAFSGKQHVTDDSLITEQRDNPHTESQIGCQKDESMGSNETVPTLDSLICTGGSNASTSTSHQSRSSSSSQILDSIFNAEALEQALLQQSGHMDTETLGTSRFSQWFSTKDAGQVGDRGPEHHKDFHQSSEPNGSGKTLLEFLQRSKLPGNVLIHQPSHAIPSVEELEAKMRKMEAKPNEFGSSMYFPCVQMSTTVSGEHDNGAKQSQLHVAPVSETRHPLLMIPHQQQRSQQIQQPTAQDASQSNLKIGTGDSDDETEKVESFKKLLEQLGGSTGGPGENSKPRQEMTPNFNSISHPQLTPYIQMLQPPHGLSAGVHHLIDENIGPAQPPHSQLGELNKLSIHLAPQQAKMTAVANVASAAHVTQPADGLVPVLFAMHVQSPQKRLEAYRLFHSVLRGEVNVGFLEQELVNPNLGLQSREIIAIALLEASRVTAANILQQHHQLAASTTCGGQDLSLPPYLPTPPVTTTAAVGTPLPPHHSLPPLTLQHLQPQHHSSGAGQTHALALQQQHKTAPSGQQPSPVSGQAVFPLPSALMAGAAAASAVSAAELLNNRDLHYHSIVKKKLDEHQEQQDLIMRMRQQTHHHLQQKPSDLLLHESAVIQQQRMHVNSPTPVTFTPTSVLRKMTAEKETNNQVPQQQQQKQQSLFISPQQPPRMILGGNHHTLLQHQQQHIQKQQGMPPPQAHLQPPPLSSAVANSNSGHLNAVAIATAVSQQQQHNKWLALPLGGQAHVNIQQQQLLNANLSQMMKPLGRPILKGPILPQQQSPHTGVLPQLPYASKVDMQQFQQQQQSQQQLFQQQRALALQRQQHQFQRSAATAANSGLVGSHSISGVTGSVAEAATMPAGNGTGGFINYQRDGGLSPTSNQLAQWFSPELLAQASAGKLPLLNVNQTLSLEEFERNIQHSSSTTAVHN